MQEIGESRLCGERDETVDHIISRCSKLAQGNTRLVRKGVPLEIAQELEF